MKIFISWSGQRSRLIAEKLHTWIPDVIQTADPWMSAENINIGEKWSRAVETKLQECHFGIICLTKENLRQPWILFESGAIAKSMDDAAICPYLIGNLESSNLNGSPLSQFQAAKANYDSTLNLMRSINAKSGPEQLSEQRLKKYFDAFWPELEEVLKSLPVAELDEKEIDENDLGIENIYQTRGDALTQFSEVLKSEIHNSLTQKNNFIWIVGSSLQGFLKFSNYAIDPTQIIAEAVRNNCELRFLLTDPEISKGREKAERRETGQIGNEIRHTVNQLKRLGVKRESIKYFHGTPTVFAIATSRKMLINPYPHAYEAEKCFTLIVHDKIKKQDDIYDQYRIHHFEKPWDDSDLSREIPEDDWTTKPNHRNEKQVNNLTNKSTI